MLAGSFLVEIGTTNPCRHSKIGYCRLSRIQHLTIRITQKRQKKKQRLWKTRGKHEKWEKLERKHWKLDETLVGFCRRCMHFPRCRAEAGWVTIKYDQLSIGSCLGLYWFYLVYMYIYVYNISCIYILIYLFEQKSHNLALPLSPKVALGPWFWILGYPIRERISTSISRIPIILGFDQPPQVSTHVPGQRSRLSESSGELVQNWWYLAAGISAAGASILPKPNHLPSQA